MTSESVVMRLGKAQIDARFAWHSRYGYWQNKLSKLLTALGATHGSFGAARRLLHQRIAVLELLPYHSTSFGVPDRVLNKLESVRLAQSFLHEQLVPRAKSGDCLIVVTRAAKKWGALPKHRNIIAYGASAARSAHLTPGSDGGKAILRFLGA
jgi:hypothetical protein